MNDNAATSPAVQFSVQSMSIEDLGGTSRVMLADITHAALGVGAYTEELQRRVQHGRAMLLTVVEQLWACRVEPDDFSDLIHDINQVVARMTP